MRANDERERSYISFRSKEAAFVARGHFDWNLKAQRRAVELLDGVSRLTIQHPL